MKFKMLSVVVGKEACPAKCPFCVSGDVPSAENMHSEISDKKLRRYYTAVKLATMSGAETLMFTGRGEPTLYPKEITKYLIGGAANKFPIIELQTNGVPLANDNYNNILEDWYERGLNLITISVVSHLHCINKQVYSRSGKEYYNLPALIKKLHHIGFSVRLTCVMCKDWMDTPKKVQEFLDFAQENEVEQVTMRPLNDEYRRESARLWINHNKLSDEDKEAIWNYLDDKGTRLLDIEKIGVVFDVQGQNVMFSSPLTKFTRDADPENGRQLILFEDGRIGYEWEMKGGTIL